MGLEAASSLSPTQLRTIAQIVLVGGILSSWVLWRSSSRSSPRLDCASPSPSNSSSGSPSPRLATRSGPCSTCPAKAPRVKPRRRSFSSSPSPPSSGAPPSRAPCTPPSTRGRRRWAPRPAERARAPRRRVVLRRLLRPHPMDRRRPRSRGRVVLDRRSRTERAGVPSLLLLPPAVVRCRVRGGGVLPRRREARRVDAIGGGDGSGAGRHASRTSRATPRARGCLRGCRRGGYRCVRRGGFRRGGCLPERSAFPERRRGGRRARPASITPSTGRVPAHPDRGVDVSPTVNRVWNWCHRGERGDVYPLYVLMAFGMSTQGLANVCAYGLTAAVRSHVAESFGVRARWARGNATEGVARVDEALEMGTRDSEGFGVGEDAGGGDDGERGLLGEENARADRPRAAPARRHQHRGVHVREFATRSARVSARVSKR